MGGDNAPDANIKGAINAINKVKAEIILVGKEDVIRSKIKEFYGKEMEEISDRLKIRNATETIEMEDQPTIAIKHKKDSSMVVGFNMLKQDDGDVFISAGNSGALRRPQPHTVSRAPPCHPQLYQPSGQARHKPQLDRAFAGKAAHEGGRAAAPHPADRRGDHESGGL